MGRVDQDILADEDARIQSGARRRNRNINKAKEEQDVLTSSDGILSSTSQG